MQAAPGLDADDRTRFTLLPGSALPAPPPRRLRPVPASAHPAMSAQPERIGKYLVETVLGHGSMGVVYRGFHLGFEHPIAIKCLKTPPGFSPQGPPAIAQVCTARRPPGGPARIARNRERHARPRVGPRRFSAARPPCPGAG